MATPHDARAKAARTYNHASDFYDHAANTFWSRYGRRTVERLRLKRGARVLDVCCGTGASAIPAAEAVGPEGRVLAVDLAEDLLGLARAKAQALALANIELRAGDAFDLGLPDASFDAAVCVFGIFFVPDMSGAARELWRLVRPGGKLAITTWGPRTFEPLDTVFWNAVRAVRPDLYKSFNPWDRINDPPSLRAMLGGAGIEAVDIVAEAGEHPLPTPEDGLALVLGTGYRGTLEQLDAGGRERVRRACLDFLRESRVAAVEASAVYAVATKRG